MAETPALTPIQIAKAAHDAEYALWTFDSEGYDIGLVKRGSEIIWSGDANIRLPMLEDLRSDASWRAALRALAEMEPTTQTRSAAFDTAVSIAVSAKEREILERAIKNYILAAAAEGEGK